MTLSPQRTFYSLSSFFANIDESGVIAYFTKAVPTPAMPLTTKEQRKSLAEKEEFVWKKENLLKTVEESARQRFEDWLTKRPSQFQSPDREVYLNFDEAEENGSRYPNLAQPSKPARNAPLNVSVAGHRGKAIQTTGDDPLEVKYVGEYERDQPWSASIWVRLAELKPCINLMTRGKGAENSASMGYELLLLDGVPTLSVVHFWPGNAIRVQAQAPLSVGEWIHLGASYDGSSRAGGLKIYLNGEPTPTTIVRDGLTRSINSFTRLKKGDKSLGLALGFRYREAGLRNGLIDEFQFWSREISALEMKQAFDEQTLGKLAEYSESENERQLLFDYYVQAIDEPSKQARAELQLARQHWNKAMDRTRALSIMRETEEPRKAYILERGAYLSHGVEVTANTPDFLPPMRSDQPKNRLGLAQWLTSRENPLTSRVTVNRYWQLIFGQGLVATPEDFGNQGTPPTHPELLDWLASDFISSNWDVQALLKKMVLSATYRQSTVTTPELRERDPENLLLARAHATRLPAEMIRDNALAVSGLLVDKWGGPSVKPYQVEVSFYPTPPDQGEGLYRRSVYTWWKRNATAPVLTTFGVPKRDVCTVKREFTTSPLQALILLNDPQFLEASRILAGNLLAEFGWNPDSLVETGYRLLTSRKPTSEEAAILLNLLQNQVEHFEEHPEESEKILKVGATPQNPSFPNPQQAATTLLLNAIMNLDECLTER